MSNLPPCRPHHRRAVALYVVPDPTATIPGRHVFRSEPVTVRDQQWMVERGGKLVALDTVKPQPDALQFADGTCERGFSDCWPDLDSFLRAHGLDPNPVVKKEVQP